MSLLETNASDFLQNDFTKVVSEKEVIRSFNNLERNILTQLYANNGQGTFISVAEIKRIFTNEKNSLRVSRVSKDLLP